MERIGHRRLLSALPRLNSAYRGAKKRSAESYFSTHRPNTGTLLYGVGKREGRVVVGDWRLALLWFRGIIYHHMVFGRGRRGGVGVTGTWWEHGGKGYSTAVATVTATAILGKACIA